MNGVILDTLNPLQLLYLSILQWLCVLGFSLATFTYSHRNWTNFLSASVYPLLLQ